MLLLFQASLGLLIAASIYSSRRFGLLRAAPHLIAAVAAGVALVTSLTGWSPAPSRRMAVLACVAYLVGCVLLLLILFFHQWTHERRRRASSARYQQISGEAEAAISTFQSDEVVREQIGSVLAASDDYFAEAANPRLQREFLDVMGLSFVGFVSLWTLALSR